MRTQPTPSSRSPILSTALPSVWTLTTEKAGDRAQIMTLATALGWPVEEKRLAFNPLYKKNNLLLGASLKSLDRKRSDRLIPPWPDLVIASGRRSVPVARWIRRQAGGRTRLVHIGRPWAPLRLFDLVISTAQYRLPARANVLVNTLTLNRPDDEALAAAAARWAPVFAPLPRPLIAVLVGGDARPFVLTTAAAAALGDQATALAARQGGSLAVTTSRRSSDPAVDRLFAHLPAASFRHRFGDGEDNPYRGLLALADRFIVTGDSASMLSEACRTGKPVHLFPLPEQPDRKVRKARRLRQRYLGRNGERRGPLRAYYNLLVELGLVKSTRDMTAFHRALAAEGLVQPLDAEALDTGTLDTGALDAEGAAVTTPPEETALKAALEHVRALFPAVARDPRQALREAG
jgi:mitochondrial fission protein ELM1